MFLIQQLFNAFVMGWQLPASFIILMILVIIYKKPVTSKLNTGTQGAVGKVSKVVCLAMGLPLLMIGLIMSFTPNSYAPILGIPLGLLGLVLTIVSLSIDNSVPKK